MRTAAHAPGQVHRQPLRSASASWRGLWQLPVFCLGVAAFATVLALGHDWPSSQRSRARAALQRATLALAVQSYDQALEIAEVALRTERGAVEFAGDFHFIMGSACLKKAEAAAAADRSAWLHRCRAELASASRLGVSLEHRAPLEYRILRAEFLSGQRRPQLEVWLARNLEDNPVDRIEGYAWLVQLHLDQSPPDLEGALKANEKLLVQPNLPDPNPVRLQRGRLLLQLQHNAQARQVLSRIPPAAPEYAEARHRLALSFFQDEEWEQATVVWEEFLESRRGKHQPFYAEALFHLGEAYLERRRNSHEGLQAWERLCRELPDSEEARAACLRLAEFYVASDQADEALRHFHQAASRGRPPFENRYLDRAAARRIVDEAWARWLQEGRFGPARELATLCRVLAEPGEAERRLAVTFRTQAERLAGQMGQSLGHAEARLPDTVLALYAKAGEAFEAAAALSTEPAAQGDLLWSAAQAFLFADRPARSVEFLEQILAIRLPDEKRQELLVTLGEAHYRLKEADKAIPPLLASLSLPGPHRVRALYLIALARLEQGDFSAAEETLREILTHRTTSGEPPEYAKALAAIGHIHYQRQQYDAAAEYLDKAAQRYAADDPNLPLLRFWMAESWRMAARQEERKAALAETQARRDFHRDAKRRYLLSACLAYIHLVKSLDRLKAVRPLTKAEIDLERTGRFRIGACWFDQGDYEEAIVTYDTLARDCDGEPDALRALVELRRVYLTMQRIPEALRTLDRAQAILENLSDESLRATNLTREQWRDWLANARRNSHSPEQIVKP